MSTQRCPDISELDRLATNALEASRSEELRDHLAACAACAGQAEEIAENLRVADDFRAHLRNERADASPPARIGAYRILGEIGRGGMGVVYEAEDETLGRRVALKVLHAAGVTVTAEAVERLRKEARLLASLNHPNLATIHSLEQSDGLHFLTMELVQGDSLAPHLRAGRMTIENALLIVRQIAKALEAAHSRGIVHRDLKPHNVMAPDDGPVKVLDFGIATALDRAASGDGPREQAGTPGYMSPEQVEGRAVDDRTDIWALGCLLFECLSGHRPMTGATPAQRMKATLEGQIAWARVPDDVPERVIDLMRRCLSQEAGRRPSATAVVEVLEYELARPAFFERFDTPPPNRTGNLPRRVSSFVGREAEMRSLRERLSEHRLVSLIGPGGCGKSRLALEAAASLTGEFPDGVWLIDLTPVKEPEAVPRRMAEVLRIHTERKASVIDAVTAWLGHRRALLLLDNCDHLIAACAQSVAHVLEDTSGTRVLATSREALGLTGESILATQPLHVPASDDLEAAMSSDSVLLFAARAAAIVPEFAVSASNVAAVAQICRRLDGLPLALELAAARARVLTPAEIAKHLDDRFRLLSGGSRAHVPRHQTMAASIDWSIGLLTEPEKKVLNRLAVFSGGWTLNAAEAVCAGGDVSRWEVFECFSRLVNKSLVERSGDASEGEASRYRMLESIRHYTLDRLTESGEMDAVRRRHCEFFRALAEEVEPKLMTIGQELWKRRLAEDHENLRSAIDYAVASGDAGTAMAIAGALGRFWGNVGRWTEGRAIYEKVLEQDASGVRPLHRIKCLNWAGNLAAFQGDYDPARERMMKSLDLCRASGERWYEASAHNNLGSISRFVGDFESAERHHRMSLAIREELGDDWAVGLSLMQIGTLAARQGRFEEALPFLERSLEHVRLNGDASVLGVLMVGLGLAHNGTGHPDLARSSFEEALRVVDGTADPWVEALILHHFAEFALQNGDQEAARAHLLESVRLREPLDDRQANVQSMTLLAHYLLSRNEVDEAARFLGAARTIREGSGIALALVEKHLLQGVQDRVRDALDATRRAELESEGGAWPMDLAMARALEAVDGVPTRPGTS